MSWRVIVVGNWVYLDFPCLCVSLCSLGTIQRRIMIHMFFIFYADCIFVKSVLKNIDIFLITYRGLSKIGDDFFSCLFFHRSYLSRSKSLEYLTSEISPFSTGFLPKAYQDFWFPEISNQWFTPRYLYFVLKIFASRKWLKTQKFAWNEWNLLRKIFNTS